MVERITASADRLMEQASMTACEYLDEAVRKIDSTFGTGYAKQHPELVAGFMQTAAADFGATRMAAALEAVADSLDSVAGAIGGVERVLDRD